MERGKFKRDQYGKLAHNAIADPCPNSSCTLKRTNHTAEQASRCKYAACN